MRTLLAVAALLAASVLTNTVVLAADHSRVDGKVTVAVFGDNASLLLDSVNADRDVSLLIHIGDIPSGSMPCTSTGILPPIPASNPGWNLGTFHQFRQFKFPVVYTPGDNEWTGCWRSASNAGSRTTGNSWARQPRS